MLKIRRKYTIYVLDIRYFYMELKDYFYMYNMNCSQLGQLIHNTSIKMETPNKLRFTLRTNFFNNELQLLQLFKFFKRTIVIELW